MCTKTQLFCLPYAGGSSVIYKDWKHYLNPEIEIIPIELAGRGKRIHEPCCSNLNETVEDVLDILKNNLTTSNYAIFGHSLGALIAYFLCQKIRDIKFQEPIHAFFSGKAAIHIEKSNDKKIHLLKNDDFVKEIASLGGTPSEFFEHPELLELFLPMLRSDFKIAEFDVDKEEIKPLDINISAFFGTKEDLTIRQKSEWKLHTTKRFFLHYFNGDHFFINTQVKAIAQQINKQLSNPN